MLNFAEGTHNYFKRFYRHVISTRCFEEGEHPEKMYNMTDV